MPDEFDADRIRDLLGALDRELQRRGVAGTIFIVGGAAMALAYDASRVTGDIDATLLPRDVLLDAARAVAETERIDPRWLSDGVLQLMPPRGDDHPREIIVGPALTVTVASAQYVLAMKAMTMRQSDGDRDDAAMLCKQLGITSTAQIEEVVTRFFGGTGQFGARELFFERIIDSLERR
jgi:hypothetical protein